MELPTKHFVGVIDDVNVASTGSKQRPDGTKFDWTLVRVAAGGMQFTTFDTKYLTMKGHSVEFDYTEEARKYTGRDGVERDTVDRKIVTRKPQDQILADMAEIKTMLATINGKLDMALGVNPAAEMGRPDDFPPGFGDDIPLN